MLHFNAHQPIWVILGIDVAEKVCKYYFSPSHFCVTALPSMTNRHTVPPMACVFSWKMYVALKSDDLLPSRMHAAVFSTGQWLRRRGFAGFSPICQWGATQKWL